MESLVVAFERCALHHFVGREIAYSDEPSMRRHSGGQALRRFAFVEFLSAAFSNTRQRFGEFRLLESLARFLARTVPQENTLRFRVRGEHFLRGLERIR